MNFFKAHICKLLFANIMNLFFSSYLLQRYFLLLFVFLLFFCNTKIGENFFNSKFSPIFIFYLVCDELFLVKSPF